MFCHSNDSEQQLMFEFFPGETPEIRSHNNSDNISNVNNVVNNINNGNSNITNNNVVNKSNDINNDIVNNNNNNVSNNNNNNIQNYRNMIDNNSNDNNILDNDKVYRMLMKTKSYHSETPIQSQTQIKSEKNLTFGGSVIDKIEQKEGNFIKGNREPNYEIGNSGETFQIDESKEDSLLKLNKLLKENCKNDFGGHSQIPEKNPIFCLFPEKISTQVEVGGEVKKFDEMRNVLKNTNVRNVLQNVIPSNINTSNIHKNDINIDNSNLIDVHTNLNMNLRTTIRTGKIHDEENIFVNQDIGISDHLVPPISFSENNKDSNNYLSRFDEDPLMCEEISKTNFDIFLEGEGEGEGEGEVIEEGDGHGNGDGDGDGDRGRSEEAILEEIDTFDGYLN